MLKKTLTDGHLGFFGAKEHLISLSNKKGDITVIRSEELKSFSNLTTKWIPNSKLGQLLWVICIDTSLSIDSDKKFPKEAHKIYTNKIACEVISEGIFKALQVDVMSKKLTNDKVNNINGHFNPITGEHFNDTIFCGAIAVKMKCWKVLYACFNINEHFCCRQCIHIKNWVVTAF
jgi:hypothetical protein